MDDQNAGVGRKKMSEEGTSEINWITQRTPTGDGKRRQIDILSSLFVLCRREIISHRDSIGGGFIWRHLSALLLLRNHSFMFCACLHQIFALSLFCHLQQLPCGITQHQCWNWGFLLSLFFQRVSVWNFDGGAFSAGLKKLTMWIKTVSRQIHLASDASVYFYLLMLAVSWKCSVPGRVPVMRASDPDRRGQIGLEGFLTWTVLRLKSFEVGSCLHQKPRWRPQFVLVNNYQTIQGSFLC